MAPRLLLFTLLALAGCDNAIETPPSLNTYTLWGALDPTADVQAVRVIRVADTLVTRTAAPLPVTVASVDLSTGVETPWRDSVVTFHDQSIGHVYHAAFRPEYGERYRIVVRRDAGGNDVTSTVRVPPRSEPSVRFSAAGGARAIVFWPGAEHLNRLRITYVLQRAGDGDQEDACKVDSVTLGVSDLSGPAGPTDGGWTLVLNFARLGPVLRDYLTDPPEDPADPLPSFGLLEVTVRGEVATRDWIGRGGVTDFESLAAPEILDTVEGGFGFIGGAYRTRITFDVAHSDLPFTGFVDTRTGPPLGCIGFRVPSPAQSL